MTIRRRTQAAMRNRREGYGFNIGGLGLGLLTIAALAATAIGADTGILGALPG